MTTERGPDVIERMVTKYINTLNHQPEDCRDATLAMLAAVRELILILAERDDFNSDAAHSVMRTIVEDHMARRGK